MASNLPENSAVEPVEPVERSGVFRRGRAGGPRGLYKSPGPPAPTPGSSGDSLSAGCSTGERFALVRQAVPDPGGAPAIIRLRRFLKMALRSYGLRCTRCEPVQAADSGEE